MFKNFLNSKTQDVGPKVSVKLNYNMYLKYDNVDTF